jgi:hypothetical protein
MLMICRPPPDAGSDAEGGLGPDASTVEASLAMDASEEPSDEASPADGPQATEAGGDP